MEVHRKGAQTGWGQPPARHPLPAQHSVPMGRCQARHPHPSPMLGAIKGQLWLLPRAGPPESCTGERSFTRAMSLSLGDAGVTSARNTFSTAMVAAPDRRSEPAFTRQLWMMGLFLRADSAVTACPPRGDRHRALCEVLITGQLSSARLKSRGEVPTHLKQCAAVSTQPGAMMLPPQMCSFLYCRLTCQGHASMAAGLPPSTRGVLTLCPQSVRGHLGWDRDRANGGSQGQQRGQGASPALSPHCHPTALLVCSPGLLEGVQPSPACSSPQDN